MSYRVKIVQSAPVFCRAFVIKGAFWTYVFSVRRFSESYTTIRMIQPFFVVLCTCGVLGDHFVSPDGLFVLFPTNQTSTGTESPLLLPVISQSAQKRLSQPGFSPPSSPLLPILTAPSPVRLSVSPPVLGPALPRPLPTPVVTPLCTPMTGGLIHHARRNSAYHLSWCTGPKMLNWAEAATYCQNLRRDFQPVSIEDKDEDDFITDIIAKHQIQFIWTSGNKRGSSSWQWLSGSAFIYANWSPTGGRGQPQPDNREGNEDCLGVLKNVYNDGIKWHDIACHHVKPVICEAAV
nr:collectin-12-like [Procambarus clarkii]